MVDRGKLLYKDKDGNKIDLLKEISTTDKDYLISNCKNKEFLNGLENVIKKYGVNQWGVKKIKEYISAEVKKAEEAKELNKKPPEPVQQESQEGPSKIKIEKIIPVREKIVETPEIKEVKVKEEIKKSALELVPAEKISSLVAEAIQEAMGEEPKEPKFTGRDRSFKREDFLWVLPAIGKTIYNYIINPITDELNLTGMSTKKREKLHEKNVKEYRDEMSKRIRLATEWASIITSNPNIDSKQNTQDKNLQKALEAFNKKLGANDIKFEDGKYYYNKVQETENPIQKW